MGELGAVDESSWFFRFIVRKRVAWGFAFAALFLVCAAPSRASVLLGCWIALAGEALRTWSSGALVKNEALTVDGPYRLVRNPLYVGNFLIGLGVSIMGGALWIPVAFAAVFVPVYRALVLKEEKRLLERYGRAFRAYCGEVPRFVPKLRMGRLSVGPYDRNRMWRTHREWRAWLGLYAVTLYLLLRAGS